MDLTSKYHLLSEFEHEFEFINEFPMDTTGVFQDLHQLDNLSHTSSSFDPDYTTHVGGYDPFGPLSYGLGTNDVDLYEFKPTFQHVNDGGIVVNSYNQNKSLLGWNQAEFSTRLSQLVECPIQNPKPMSYFVPDEGSCITADNGIKKGNRKPCKGKNNANSAKGQWTKEEDRILKEMVERYGVRKWSYIAQMLKGRIGKQCRERWHNHLRPDIKKDFWTEEEDRILIAAHAEVGNKWSEIAKKLPGRTENSTKNHWNATKRRQYTRRKCRSKWPKPSPILQNYIKSLNLPRGRMNSNRNNDHTLAVAKPSDSVADQGNFDFNAVLKFAMDSTSSNNHAIGGVKPSYSVADFDFNEVTEFAMDEKLLLEWDDNVDSLFDDLPSNNEVGEADSYLQGEVKKEMDLMEMISQVNL
ncbi:transcription factor MYB98-like [Rutidosis leptorrhynchoides]|uniref:transcription factor MYB98-like n=1 Tax=Rutidosis leptorrhynchoides TaxID=125765 RepID=UPI003A990160